MKKVLLILMILSMFTALIVPISSENAYDLLVDFNTVESIAAYKPNGSTTVGLQSLLSISDDVALVNDEGRQVLYYPKTKTDTYGGFNMQPIPTAASNYIFYTFEIKVAKLTEGGLVTLGYVDLAKKWVYGWGIIGTANGNGELVCDLNMNHDKTKPSAYDHWTTLASLRKDRYYTVTVKYDLVNQKQSIYLDGVELSSGKGFVNEAPLDYDSHSYEGKVTIQTPMRCVLFHMYQGEYECYYRQIGVYSSQTSEVPYEYIDVSTPNFTYLYGYQTNAAKDAIRFVALVNKAQFEANAPVVGDLGFRFSDVSIDGDAKTPADIAATAVYSSLSVMVDDEISAYYCLDCFYMMVVTITDIPAEGDITLTVTPFFNGTDGNSIAFTRTAGTWVPVALS